MIFKDQGGFEIKTHVYYEERNSNGKLIDDGDGDIYSFTDDGQKAWVIKRRTGEMVTIPLEYLKKLEY